MEFAQFTSKIFKDIVLKNPEYAKLSPRIPTPTDQRHGGRPRREQPSELLTTGDPRRGSSGKVATTSSRPGSTWTASAQDVGQWTTVNGSVTSKPLGRKGFVTARSEQLHRGAPRPAECGRRDGHARGSKRPGRHLSTLGGRPFHFHPRQPLGPGHRDAAGRRADAGAGQRPRDHGKEIRTIPTATPSVDSAWSRPRAAPSSITTPTRADRSRKTADPYRWRRRATLPGWPWGRKRAPGVDPPGEGG